ncbi:hypothetical protein ES703_30543 [subsurface metagenome]
MFRTQKVKGLLYVANEWIPRIRKLFVAKKGREIVR